MVESKMVVEIETVPQAPEEVKQEDMEQGPPPTLGEIILALLKAFQEHRSAVLETGDIDSVHRMRVTTRRLQAALDLLLMRNDELGVRKLKKRLRRWRRLLSTVRNYDVFLIMLDKPLSSRRSSQKNESLKTLLQERRQRRMENIHPRVERMDINIIASRLGLSLSAPETEPTDIEVEESESSDGSGRTNIPGVSDKSIALHTAARLEQRVSEFLSLASYSHPATNPVELHELRIAAKRVRYILEIVSEMGYGDASSALRWLKSLQDKIGDWHDLESLEGEIIGVVARRKFIKENLTECSRMLQEAARLRKKKDALVAKLFPVKVPRNLTATSERLIRVLRREARREGSKDAALSEPFV